MATVSVRKVVKAYDGDVQAVRDIDLEIADHEFAVLVGPSGCGKSTTLRMIGGLEEISAGEIWIGGDIVGSRSPTSRPGWTRPRASSTSCRCWSASPLPCPVGSGSASPWAAPSCATPRCSCSTSRCPTSTPSCACRCAPRSRKVHQTVRTTTVYMTHDQIEAMTLADRVVVMNHDRIEQVGPPQELYHHPKTRFVAGFIGSPAMNFFAARVVAPSGAPAVRLADGQLLPIPPARQDRYAAHRDRDVVFGLRPEHLTEPREQGRSGIAPFRITADVVEPMGMETLVHFFLGSEPGCARVDPQAPVAPAAPPSLAADMSHMHLIDPSSGQVS